MENRTLCLPTLDPRATGGVRSVTEFIYDRASESGLQPYLVFNSVTWEECMTFRDLLRGDFQTTYQFGNFYKMSGIRIGRRFPEVRVLNYLTNIRYWKRALDLGNAYFGLGGPCLPCLPLAIEGIPFGCWVGTTIYDEQQVQLEQLPLARRTRDRLTLPVVVRYEEFILDRANIVVAQSQYTKRRIQKLYNVPESKIKKIPYPINIDSFKPAESESHSTEILFVGRLNDPRKNINLLVEAFAQVQESVPQATLTLVGEEPSDKLESKCEQLDVDDSVAFEGRVPKVAPYLQRAGIFAFPSKQEGLGIAGLEAMSCGTPVVATKCGGPEDYIVDGENGFLVDNNDATAFASRLVDIISDERLQKRLGETARSTVMDAYAEDVVGPQILSVIKELPTT